MDPAAIIKTKSPTIIIEMAQDPAIPAPVVIAAAVARSRTGRLLKRVLEILAERGPELLV